MKVGYARVSTEDQRLDLQLTALKNAGCNRIFKDHGISGAEMSRPGLEKMLRTMLPGQTLVVWRLDRLGRSLVGLVQLVDELGRRNIGFQSITEELNTTTSGGAADFSHHGGAGRIRTHPDQRTHESWHAGGAKQGKARRPPAQPHRSGRAQGHARPGKRIDGGHRRPPRHFPAHPSATNAEIPQKSPHGGRLNNAGFAGIAGTDHHRTPPRPWPALWPFAMPLVRHGGS